MNSNDPQPRIVIVGGGFGGLAAARGFRNASVKVTLVDQNNYHLFQPLLYQVATAGLSAGDISEPIRSILKRQKNTEVLMAEVKGIDPGKQQIQLPDRALDYDFLILAPGGRYNYFGHREWEALAPGLKTVEDAFNIRRRVLSAFEEAEMEPDPEKRKALLTFLIIGGGPTGVELAGAIAELAHKVLAEDFRHIHPKNAHILLLEAGDRLLPAFTAPLSEKARQALLRLGIKVHLHCPVEKISAEGVWMQGEFFPAHTKLWAAGILASPLLNSLNCPLDRTGRAIVDPDLSIPGHPEIFVIGDAAAFVEAEKPLPGIAPVAKQEGVYVAKRILGKIKGAAVFPSFHYQDRGQMATVGRSFALFEWGKIKLAGFFAWILWLFIHLFFLIGMQNRILVFMQWAWHYLTYERGARVIPPESSHPSSES